MSRLGTGDGRISVLAMSQRLAYVRAYADNVVKFHPYPIFSCCLHIYFVLCLLSVSQAFSFDDRAGCNPLIDKAELISLAAFRLFINVFFSALRSNHWIADKMSDLTISYQFHLRNFGDFLLAVC